ncbi:MAG: hypothetical protein U0136_21940 [Bdellovibrionota bacterium]
MGKNMQFEEICQFLSVRYPLRDVRVCGEETFVIFAEMHSQVNQRRISHELLTFHRSFPQQLVGVEGYAFDHRRDGAMVAVTAAEVLRGCKCSAEQFDAKKIGEYAPLFFEQGLHAIGLEADGQALIPTFNGQVAHYYRHLLQNAVHGIPSIFFRKGQLVTKAAALLRLCEYLKERFADFPAIEVNKLKSEGEGDERVVSLGDSELTYMTDLYESLTNWQRKHSLFGRSSFAAEVSLRELRRQQGKLGALVVGAGHTVCGLEKKSLQEHLADAGVSSIVVDPARSDAGWEEMVDAVRSSVVKIVPMK